MSNDLSLSPSTDMRGYGLTEMLRDGLLQAIHSLEQLGCDSETLSFLRATANAQPQPETGGRRWTLLLTGPHNGNVGHAQDTFGNHPAHYERVKVVEVGASPPPSKDYSGLVAEINGAISLSKTNWTQANAVTQFVRLLRECQIALTALQPPDEPTAPQRTDDRCYVTGCDRLRIKPFLQCSLHRTAAEPGESQ